MVKIGNTYYAKARNPIINQKGESGGALTGMIQFLLEKGLIDAALVMKKGLDIYDAVPVLIEDPEDITGSAGSLHCGTSNMAKIVVKYLEGAQDIRLAITTKPCDARTLNELIKMGKIKQDNVIMFGLNCGGTLPPFYTRDLVEKRCQLKPDQIFKEEITRGKLIIHTKNHDKHEFDIDQLEKNGYGRRSNCQRCEVNIPCMADLAFGNWGVIGPSAGKSTFIEVFSLKGAEILKKAIKANYIMLEKPSPEGIHLRWKIDKNMIELAHKWQSKVFAHENHDIVSVLARYREEFKKCIKCFGCREACPICCCKECTLESDTFNGIYASKIPVSLNFHLERMIHMVDNCTNCGQCEDACPVDIPLASIWHEVNLDIKKIFKYYSGMDDQLPPLSYLMNRN